MHLFLVASTFDPCSLSVGEWNESLDRIISLVTSSVLATNSDGLQPNSHGLHPSTVPLLSQDVSAFRRLFSGHLGTAAASGWSMGLGGGDCLGVKCAGKETRWVLNSSTSTNGITTSSK